MNNKALNVAIVILAIAVIVFPIVFFTLTNKEEGNQPSATSTTSTAAEQPVLSASYDEIYKAFKENALRAEDTYTGNRYRVTAEVNGISTGGLFNLTGGATLTMKIQVDNTIVFFLAEFENEQEEALKTINVGDTVTFEGECRSDELWTECKLR